MFAPHTFVAILILAGGQYVASEARAEFTYTLDEGYPIGKKLFGNIAGVDVDGDGNVIIFHRGSHKWDETTFDASDVYSLDRNSPIPEETVVTIDPKEKKIIRAWGRNLFYMPHGLSLDLEGKNIWLTDVALHQVFKYSIDGSKELMALGTAFIPGNDDIHFCKPTSVADTGDFIFIADGYCNSRVVMFSAIGKYLGEFGQSSEMAFNSNSRGIQPTFNIPHKITYAKEAKMICVADRENGRIQCFSFEPQLNKLDDTNNGVILNGAIKSKFIIADPQFNGRLFSLDYSPVRGGIIIAVSGQSPYNVNKPALGFVYNVTTGQLISRFSPRANRTFGMAHDLAIAGEEANSLFVVDISPVNLWKFSRPSVPTPHLTNQAISITKYAGAGINRALSMMRDKNHGHGPLWYIAIFSVIAVLVIVLNKTRRMARYSAPNSLSTLYSNTYPTSINSLFGANGYNRRLSGNNRSETLLSTMFSRRAFFNLFDWNRQRQNAFSRIPMRESDNSDDDKSDSDIEEFNINQANPNIKINV